MPAGARTLSLSRFASAILQRLKLFCATVNCTPVTKYFLIVKPVSSNLRDNSPHMASRHSAALKPNEDLPPWQVFLNLE
jgi:hypothetical protein